MANFTSEIKNEIIQAGFGDREEEKAALSAFLRASGELGYDFFTKKYSFEFVVESENVAEFFMGIIEENYAVPMVTTALKDRLSGNYKFRFECKDGRAEEILSDLSILDKKEHELILTLPDKYFNDGRTGKAFIKGAFLGGGSCTIPQKLSSKTSYHLQVAFSSWQIANDFSGVMSESDILTKQIEHKGSFVVYISSKEAISDFLSVIECDDALASFTKIVDERDNANNANRSSNCASGNKNRSMRASAAQYFAIQEIERLVGLESLPAHLQKIAKMRLERKEDCLQDIADALNLTKSCVNHRMKKIIEIYDSLNK